MKVLMDDNPLAPSNAAPTDFRAAYRARPAWITPRRPRTPPEVTAYRLRFDLPQAATIRAHVSADERYLLFVDGQLCRKNPGIDARLTVHRALIGLNTSLEFRSS